MKVEIATVGLNYHSVDVPSACPECEADLTAIGGLLLWEYQDQSRSAHLTEAGVDVHGEDDLPHGGDSFMTLSVSCRKCRHLLAGEI